MNDTYLFLIKYYGSAQSYKIKYINIGQILTDIKMPNATS